LKPNLFSIPFPFVGHIDFPSYFTFLLLGFIVTCLLAQREAKGRGIARRFVLDLWALLLISGLLGARLLHVLADGDFWNYVHQCTDPSLVDWGYNQRECADFGWSWHPEGRCTPPYSDCTLPFQFWRGGFAFYGGIFLCLPAGIYLSWRRGVPIGDSLDLVGLTLPLSLFFGRLGCFFAGCCFGKPSELPWAVSFPAGSSASEHQLLIAQKAREIFPELSRHLPFTNFFESFAVHPTQLYESFACLLIFLYLYFVARPSQKFVGDLFPRALLLYGVARFSVEFLRDDDRGIFFGWISTSQLIAIPMIVLSVSALIYLPRRSPPYKKKREPEGFGAV
jgi:phosphatidylglycerol:prolipoprotein diacylglycerol transferase